MEAMRMTGVRNEGVGVRMIGVHQILRLIAF